MVLSKVTRPLLAVNLPPIKRSDLVLSRPELPRMAATAAERRFQRLALDDRMSAVKAHGEAFEINDGVYGADLN